MCTVLLFSQLCDHYCFSLTDFSDDGEIARNSDELTLLNGCSDMLESTIILLRERLRQFNLSCVSNVLLTLQLLHPPNLTRVSTINLLLQFQSYANNSPSLTDDSITELIHLHDCFYEQVIDTSLKPFPET